MRNYKGKKQVQNAGIYVERNIMLQVQKTGAGSIKKDREEMLGRSENKKTNYPGNNSLFKHYKVMVKILLEDKKVEYQHLEIFTTGLPQLLEMRRIHNKTFEETASKCLFDNSRNN